MGQLSLDTISKPARIAITAFDLTLEVKSAIIGAETIPN